jgi:hypothetical protein
MLLVHYLEALLVDLLRSQYVGHPLHQAGDVRPARFLVFGILSQKVTDVALPPLRSTHQWPWSKPGRSAMEGAFTSLKMEMHSSIFSGLTWMVTTRANMVFLLPDPLVGRVIPCHRKHVAYPALHCALGFQEGNFREFPFHALG